MPEIGNTPSAGPAVVYQHDVQFPALSWSGEMRRILSKRRTLRAARQKTQKYAHVFHPRNRLFNADACNMNGRNGGSDISISFIGADHEGSRFGYGEIAARHAGSGR